MVRLVLLTTIVVLAGCRPSAGGWGRVTIVESRLGPSGWTVLVDDRGQGVDVLVDGSVRQARCRRTSRGRRCWVSGVREGFHRLAVQVGGRGVARRTALSPPPRPSDLVLYSVLLDRFADGDRGNNIRVRPGAPGAPQGGDLIGLRRRLGFLKKLGVNALLLSPIWDHARTGRDAAGLPRWIGRQPRAPLRLSAALGTRPDLMRLLAAARKRRLRVLLDLPRGDLPLERYFGVVRTWLSRTLVDGFRLGPPRPGEESAWATASAALARDFSPLVLVHRVPGAEGRLRRALVGLPRSAAILEVDTGPAWLGWLGCTPTSGGTPVTARRSGRGLRARLLSSHRHPVLSRRCRAGARRAEFVGLALTFHLLTADIPVVYFADGWAAPPGSDSHPALRWPVVKRTRRHARIRRLLTLRRKVPALRRGDQRVRVMGDTLVVARRSGACRVVLVIHRGDRPRRLQVSLKDLGWPAPKAGAGPVEFVDRLRGRGVTAEQYRLTVDLEPRSGAVLVPAGHGACSG